MDVNNSGYARAHEDFYIEPSWTFDTLVDVIGRADFARGVYDPACGAGTIPVVAKALGLNGVGSDIVDRPKVGPFKFTTRDFLEQRTLSGWPAIVMNPPFKRAQEFIEKALRETKKDGIVACLVPISFLASQARYDFFRGQTTERVIVLSKRPSMPPGDAWLKGEMKRGNGKANYAWLIFRVGGRRGAKTVIDWGKPANGAAEDCPPAFDPTRSTRGLWPAQISLFDGEAP